MSYNHSLQTIFYHPTENAKQKRKLLNLPTDTVYSKRTAFTQNLGNVAISNNNNNTQKNNSVAGYKSDPKDRSWLQRIQGAIQLKGWINRPYIHTSQLVTNSSTRGINEFAGTGGEMRNAISRVGSQLPFPIVNEEQTKYGDKQVGLYPFNLSLDPKDPLSISFSRAMFDPQNSKQALESKLQKQRTLYTDGENDDLKRRNRYHYSDWDKVKEEEQRKRDESLAENARTMGSGPPGGGGGRGGGGTPGTGGGGVGGTGGGRPSRYAARRKKALPPTQFEPSTSDSTGYRPSSGGGMYSTASESENRGRFDNSMASSTSRLYTAEKASFKHQPFSSQVAYSLRTLAPGVTDGYGVNAVIPQRFDNFATTETPPWQKKTENNMHQILDDFKYGGYRATTAYQDPTLRHLTKNALRQQLINTAKTHWKDSNINPDDFVKQHIDKIYQTIQDNQPVSDAEFDEVQRTIDFSSSAESTNQASTRRAHRTPNVNANQPKLPFTPRTVHGTVKSSEFQNVKSQATRKSTRIPKPPVRFPRDEH